MKEDVLRLLEEILPDVDFSSEKLVDDKVLESLSIMTIVSEISLEYGINVPYQEIVPENFNSVDAIAALIERLQKK